MHEVAHALFELVDLGGHLLVGEEQRRVRKVDHELRGVFRLREHGLEIPWRFLVHHVSPSTTMTSISDKAPKRSRDEVTIGIPWLSGSKPTRCAATAP